MQTKQPSTGRSFHLGLHSYRGKVNAWLQSFKAQADSLGGANAAGDFKLSQYSFTIWKIPGLVRITLILLCLYCINERQSLDDSTSVHTWFAEYFKAMVRTTAQKKKIPFIFFFNFILFLNFT